MSHLTLVGVAVDISLEHEAKVRRFTLCNIQSSVQDLETQVEGQREGMEELAGRTNMLVDENEQVITAACDPNEVVVPGLNYLPMKSRT